MTPLGKAKQILEALEAEAATLSIDLPGTPFAQVGDPVVACATTTVAVSNIVPSDATGPMKCNASQMTTFLVVIARECAVTSNYDGSDNQEGIAAISDEIDKDADLLWTMANNFVAYLDKTWSVSWNITGHIGITILNFTTGVD